MRNTWAGILGLVLATGCTGSIEGDDGGGGGDDAPPKNEVRIVVRDGFTAQAGVRVIFQNDDDTVVADMMTDATGTASAEMSAGNVTVIRTYPVVSPPPPNGQRVPEVYTYMGVKGGDLLQLANDKSDTAAGAIVVKVPEGGNTNFKVTTPCGSGQGTAPNVAIAVGACPAMVGFYVTDGDNSSFFKMMPYAPAVDLSTEALLGTLTAQLSVTNVPANTQVNAEERVVTGMYTLFSSGEKRVDQTPANVNLPNIMGPDEMTIARIQTQGMGTQMVASRQPYAANPSIIDATAELIPYVMGNVEYKPASVTWTEAGTGTADAVLVMMDVTRNMPDPTGLGAEYMRMIIAPHSGATLRVPQLPDPAYNPQMMDQIAGSHGLVKATGGYDAIRMSGFASSSIVSAAPPNGKLTLSYSGNAPVRDAN